MRRVLILLCVTGLSVPVLAQSNARFNSIALGPATNQSAATQGTIRMMNGGSIDTTTASGNTITIRAWNGSTRFTVLTVTNGASPSIDLSGDVTVNGEALLPFADPAADKLFYYRNSDDSLQPVTIGSGLTFSSGTLSASVPFMMGYGAAGAGLLLGLVYGSQAFLARVRLPRRRRVFA